MMLTMSLGAFAYEVDDSREEALTPQDEIFFEDIELPEDAVVLGTYTHYLINTGGTATSSVYIPYSTVASFYGNVTLCMYLKYADNHTGTVYITFAQYDYYQTVNGTSRVVDRNMYIIPGNYAFTITGISGSTLIYSIVMYATLTTG